ncbi:hypothetical protein J2S42_006667 [Catenuloplanes indicus]|uniref:Uncharacterized protein n=1 Tax=Catenuloplanes indicus TaxID=137267 RepID=A0AAE3W527_9ACTN|nr:hypothetical protein [Catenuloplanes indicus]
MRRPAGLPGRRADVRWSGAGAVAAPADVACSRAALPGRPAGAARSGRTGATRAGDAGATRSGDAGADRAVEDQFGGSVQVCGWVSSSGDGASTHVPGASCHRDRGIAGVPSRVTGAGRDVTRSAGGSAQVIRASGGAAENSAGAVGANVGEGSADAGRTGIGAGTVGSSASSPGGIAARSRSRRRCRSGPPARDRERLRPPRTISSASMSSTAARSSALSRTHVMSLISPPGGMAGSGDPPGRRPVRPSCSTLRCRRRGPRRRILPPGPRAQSP